MGDPWGDLNAPEDTFEQHIPLFSIKPAKKYKLCNKIAHIIGFPKGKTRSQGKPAFLGSCFTLLTSFQLNFLWLKVS